MTNRGFYQSGDFEIPEGMNRQLQQMLGNLRQSLGQLTAPLPGEAVGVGAKWKVDQVISQNGVTIEQSVIYELVQLEGDRAVTRLSLTQTADPQKIVNPQVPAGFDTRLVSLKSEGTGQSHIALDKIMPLQGSVAVHSNMVSTVSAAGESQTLKMEMTVDMSLKGN